MDPTFLAQFPQYALLVLAAFAYGWLHKQHRSERSERDNDWRTFLDNQRKEFGQTIERVVGEFRDSVNEERQKFLNEIRVLSDRVSAHDEHATELAEKIMASSQGAIVQAAAQAAAQAVREVVREAGKGGVQ